MNEKMKTITTVDGSKIQAPYGPCLGYEASDERGRIWVHHNIARKDVYPIIDGYDASGNALGHYEDKAFWSLK